MPTISMLAFASSKGTGRFAAQPRRKRHNEYSSGRFLRPARPFRHRSHRRPDRERTDRRGSPRLRCAFRPGLSVFTATAGARRGLARPPRLPGSRLPAASFCRRRSKAAANRCNFMRSKRSPSSRPQRKHDGIAPKRMTQITAPPERIGYTAHGP
jgi:hypothetical protein